MKGLTAKVFRTYNASSTFQDLLDKEDLTGKTIQEKLNAYNKANRLVAILCNHHRTVSKTHGDSMNKLTHKVCFILLLFNPRLIFVFSCAA